MNDTFLYGCTVVLADGGLILCVWEPELSTILRQFQKNPSEKELESLYEKLDPESTSLLPVCTLNTRCGATILDAVGPRATMRLHGRAMVGGVLCSIAQITLLIDCFIRHRCKHQFEAAVASVHIYDLVMAVPYTKV